MPRLETSRGRATWKSSRRSTVPGPRSGRIVRSSSTPVTTSTTAEASVMSATVSESEAERANRYTPPSTATVTKSDANVCRIAEWANRERPRNDWAHMYCMAVANSRAAPRGITEATSGLVEDASEEPLADPERQDERDAPRADRGPSDRQADRPAGATGLAEGEGFRREPHHGPVEAELGQRAADHHHRVQEEEGAELVGVEEPGDEPVHREAEGQSEDPRAEHPGRTRQEPSADRTE